MLISDTECDDGVRRDNAYTKTELVRSVDFDNDARTETIREVLTEIQDELVEVAGDMVAGGMLVNDILGALGGLAAEDIVTAKQRETTHGTASYYRLSTDEAWE